MELKDKLEKKGYFDLSHKKQIPKDVSRIGVVTSKEGAVIQDIINVRSRRNPYVDIVLYPVKVQGINAEYEIAQAIRELDNYNVDLIIVARGGGSLEDLQPFNTEVVADAIFDAKKFIVSAVGHETDFTICDFCSDLRAPTPSAAAELVCVDTKEISKNFYSILKRLKNCINDIYLDNYSYVVDLLKSFTSNLTTLIDKNITTLKTDILLLRQAFLNKVNASENKFELIRAKLLKYDPNEILKLGYATIKSKGMIVTSVNQVAVDDVISVKLKDGYIESKVIKKGE